MHTPRKRTLVNKAGLLTAVTLSLCLLAGCNGARFMMGGDPSQPVNPTGTSPSTPGTSSAQTVKLSGQASLNGQAVANATVKVYNAITNQPVNIVAAGGGNYKVLQTAGTTKADGSFNIEAPVATVIRIVITTSDGRKLTSVAGGNGQGLGRSNINGGSIKVNEYTTVTDQFSRGPLKMMGALKAEVVESLVNNFLVGLNNVLNELEAKKLTPAEVDALLTNTDETGRVTNTAALDKLVDDKQIGGQVNSTVKSATQSVAEKAADRTNVIKDIQVDASDFAGTDYSITVKDGKIVITNKTTNESTTVDLSPEPAKDDDNQNPDDQTNQDPDGITEDTEAGTGDPKVAPVYSSANFQPTVSISGSLTISVTQPLGSDDVSTVYARIPKANLTSATISALTATGNVSGGTALTGALALSVEGTPNTVGLPAEFGGNLSGTREYAGKLKMGSTVVADFQVWATSSYYYLITTYALSDAVRTNGGYTTTLTASNFGSITAGTVAEVVLTSRTGETFKDFNMAIAP